MSSAAVTSYLRRIAEARHFWWYLAAADVRARFRGSRLGVVWALVQPLSLTLLMSVVLGAVFGTPMGEFALFVYSGVVVWDFLSGAAVSGCHSLVAAAPYIHQRKLPLVIYPLKTVLAATVTSGIALVGLLVWVLVDRASVVSWSLVSLAFSLPMLVALACLTATLTAFINTKMRDFQQLLGLVLQALWYLSPVFIEPRHFHRAGIAALLEWNPIAHALQLVRAPLLEGAWPRPADYASVAGLIVVLGVVVAWRIARDEDRMVFHV